MRRKRKRNPKKIRPASMIRHEVDKLLYNYTGALIRDLRHDKITEAMLKQELKNARADMKYLIDYYLHPDTYLKGPM